MKNLTQTLIQLGIPVSEKTLESITEAVRRDETERYIHLEQKKYTEAELDGMSLVELSQLLEDEPYFIDTDCFSIKPKGQKLSKKLVRDIILAHQRGEITSHMAALGYEVTDWVKVGSAPRTMNLIYALHDRLFKKYSDSDILSIAGSGSTVNAFLTLASGDEIWKVWALLTKWKPL